MKSSWCLQIEKVKPLFKKGSRRDPSNFKLISMLPLLLKTFERIVLDQTNNFLSLNKILYNYQYGFRKKHSTDTFLLSFSNDKDLKGFEMVYWLLWSWLTFEKHSIRLMNHDILLRKLSIIGFSDDTIKWFQSYLSNQKFSVKIWRIFGRFKHYVWCTARTYNWSFAILD